MTEHDVMDGWYWNSKLGRMHEFVILLLLTIIFGYWIFKHLGEEQRFHEYE